MVTRQFLFFIIAISLIFITTDSCQVNSEEETVTGTGTGNDVIADFSVAKEGTLRYIPETYINYARKTFILPTSILPMVPMFHMVLTDCSNIKLEMKLSLRSPLMEHL